MSHNIWKLQAGPAVVRTSGDCRRSNRNGLGNGVPLALKAVKLLRGGFASYSRSYMPNKYRIAYIGDWFV